MSASSFPSPDHKTCTHFLEFSTALSGKPLLTKTASSTKLQGVWWHVSKTYHPWAAGTWPRANVPINSHKSEFKTNLSTLSRISSTLFSFFFQFFSMIYSAGHVFHRHHGGPQHWAPSIISGSFFISHKLTPRISKSAGGRRRRRRGWEPLSPIQMSHELLQCQALSVSTSLPISATVSLPK